MKKLFLIFVVLIPLSPFIRGNYWSITLHAQELYNAQYTAPEPVEIDSSNWAKLNGENSFTGGNNSFDSVYVTYLKIANNTGAVPEPVNGSPINYYGQNGENYLSEPVLWLIIKVGVDEYVIPVYNKQ